ncbi:Hsp20/alpha crystallin family protein [Oesophagostomum dentatum]|uniref:Hsp20/alpha crystallin family protein n=1 Tax=Oesophagostomum dentatum TaxID=61180 RepID=A0A0B1SZE5_OESDE|nr:Hsp20/alpha crystallin family protein [Oesophagostomum dentatum]
MPLFLLPSTALFPALYDELFDDYEPLHRAIHHADHHAPPPAKQRRTDGRMQPHGGRRGRRTSEITDDDSKVTISLNVANFKPEELKVDLDGRVLTVEGKQETRDANGYSMRCFTRMWELPSNVNLDEIKSSITEEGRLAIEAPKVHKSLKNTKKIPIHRAATIG